MRECLVRSTVFVGDRRSPLSFGGSELPKGIEGDAVPAFSLLLGSTSSSKRWSEIKIMRSVVVKQKALANMKTDVTLRLRCAPPPTTGAAAYAKRCAARLFGANE